mmetsp:Transcript_14395/g.39284  ORF Transcript_14395/g.39284 Transcript_14395/m.39284 type:complete len:204 (-) Transcript_14395:2047-2658(-)
MLLSRTFPLCHGRTLPRSDIWLWARRQSNTLHHENIQGETRLTLLLRSPLCSKGGSGCNLHCLAYRLSGSQFLDREHHLGGARSFTTVERGVFRVFRALCGTHLHRHFYDTNFGRSNVALALHGSFVLCHIDLSCRLPRQPCVLILGLVLWVCCLRRVVGRMAVGLPCDTHGAPVALLTKHRRSQLHRTVRFDQRYWVLVAHL